MESSFIPFGLILAGDGSHEMRRFDDDGITPTVEGGVALGRQRLRDVNGSTRCVVLASAYELGRPTGILLIQRYERQGGRLNPIGNPVLYDKETDPLVPPKGQGRSAAFARIQQLAEEQRRRRES